MNDLLKRLAELESLQALRDSEAKKRKAFAVIKPWSVTKDDMRIVYYPHGIVGGAQEIRTDTHGLVLWLDKQINSLNSLYWSWGDCTEWMIAHYSTHPLADAEQREQWAAEYAKKYPEESASLEDAEFLEFIINQPQQLKFVG